MNDLWDAIEQKPTGISDDPFWTVFLSFKNRPTENVEVQAKSSTEAIRKGKILYPDTQTGLAVLRQA